MFILKNYRINVKKAIINQDDTQQRLTEYYEERETTLTEEFHKHNIEVPQELPVDFVDFLEAYESFAA